MGEEGPARPTLPGARKRTPGTPVVNPVVALLLGVVGVSFSSIFVRWAQAPALVTASWRLIWTVALLTPVVLLRNRKEFRALRGRDIAISGISGVFLALHFFLWFQSLGLTSVAGATALVSTDVIFTALGFALFMKGRIPPAGVAAIGVTFLGSVVIASASAGTGGALAGDAMAVGGAVCASVYLLIGNLQRGHLSNSLYTWLVYTACALALLLMDLFTGTPLVGWGAREVLIGLLLAVVCTLLGHSVLNWTLKYLSPAYLSAVKLGEPVFATVLAMLLLGEYPGPVQLAGAAVVIAGILLFTWAERRAALRKR